MCRMHNAYTQVSTETGAYKSRGRVLAHFYILTFLLQSAANLAADCLPRSNTRRQAISDHSPVTSPPPPSPPVTSTLYSHTYV